MAFSSSNPGSTLFISNLPYTVTNTDLLTLFSDYAPVRTAFVVTEPGSGVSKGVGYVGFSAKEDAQNVLERIETEGVSISGRSLRVSYADKKVVPKDGQKKEKGKEPAKPKAPSTPKTPADPLAIRTLIVNGLPSSGITAQVLWKKFRKYERCEDVKWSADSPDPTTAEVVFSNPASAQQAISKLHAHVYKGSLLSVALKRRVTVQKKPSPANRIIVRNLPFTITEADLRTVFLPHGSIYSIKLEKGFAFIWFFGKGDAEKAIEGVNGTIVKTGMAETLLKGKQLKKKELRLESKRKQEQAGEDGEEAPAEGRTVAVDWALSKDKWEEEKAKMDVDEEESISESQESESEDSSSDSDDDEGSVSSSSTSTSSVRVKPKLPDTDVGTTLFVRNIPFESTSDDLRTLFRSFGPLRYARITTDPESGRSRGTGFACFWEKSHADEVIQLSEELATQTASTTGEIKKNPFTLLTPDPSSSLAKSLVLDGRTLDVVRAVTRDAAGKLKLEGEKRREKADKRNVYLLREGVIVPNSPAAQSLPAADLERRQNSFSSRKKLLQTNPSLYISKTRLSIRQLPLFVTERLLRRMAIHAVNAFEEEVTAGTRSPLTADELEEEDNAEEDDNSTKKEKKKKKTRKTASSTVKQSKVVRQHDRVDAITGKGRSKGYAFLELFSHADALRVLRHANNNPTFSGLWDGWYKEELEDLAKILKKDGGDADRLKRVQDELTSPTKRSAKEKGTMMIEFSIENVQVVRRRDELRKNEPKRGEKRKRADTAEEGGSDGEEGVKADHPDGKFKSKKAKPLQTDTKKSSNPIGSIIGRKRKLKKSGK